MRSLANLMEGAVRDQGGAVQGFTGDGIMAVSARRSRMRTRLFAHAGRRVRFSSSYEPAATISKPGRDTAAISDRPQQRTGHHRPSARRP